MKKNTAQRIVFPILDSTGSPVTGAADPDTEYSIDGGSFSNCSDEIHELATASGVYYIDLLAAETNGDVIAIQSKTTTTGAKTTVLVFYTISTTLDLIASYIDTEVAAIKAKTDLIPADITTALDTTIPAIKAITDTLTLAAIADAVHDEVVDGSLTSRQAQKLLIGVLAGKSNGGGSATVHFRDSADAKNRVTATVDANGNRTAVTLDVT
jgi:hypothetical protein